MKYFILLVVIAGVIWWLRTKRNNSDKTQDASRQSQNPQTMVRCAHCDLHLPQSDAVDMGNSYPGMASIREGRGMQTMNATAQIMHLQ